ncbi:GPN-loop GTPase 2 [Neolecta irregularis DAH-3]|uniref:GPN-loop GTPase 2 n=1 Tax=Neolecta irregularis (strain DAH-3) TaxID=1198029 RepID=A0A1U7LGU6_NEOID|nr:GPN-loop GTPase 2 [Neolecta irregularis DAH-3]|eukprot:OLL21848.1 GPN-loop GTPase 2 [Neolecta irregularis DAH-3]
MAAVIVIGPPGSGKSTFCWGAYQLLSAVGRRCVVANIDPANDRVPYPCDINIQELVTLDEIMSREELGPNGGVIYALETLEENFEWLENKLKPLKDSFVLFDCPGQVELFTHHDSLRRILFRIEKLGRRPVIVHLVDAHYCTDAAKYISVLLLSLRAMLQLDLPHINVLSKVDTLRQYGKLDFNLDFYTEVQDLSYLLPVLERDPRMTKYTALNAAVCTMIEDFGLVGFETLCVEDKESMMRLLQTIDRVGGFNFGLTEISGDEVWAQATRGGWHHTMDAMDVQERWVDAVEEFDAAQVTAWKEEAAG